MNQSRWMLYTKRADFDSIAARFHIDPVVARIMVNRGVSEDDMDMYLNGGMECLHDPSQLMDCDKAVDIISQSISMHQKIRIVGDYDIDGVCSTYILYTAISLCGGDVDYEIPDRIKDGYGINEQIIEAANEDGVQTIITCDNGIAAIEAMQKAKDMGMTIVITDHHEVRQDDDGDVLPIADAIVDPKRSADTYPYPEICGAVVAWKFVQLLYRKMGVDEKKHEKLLPYAAIATVGDVMTLMDENRVIVKQGLRAIAYCENIGLMELIRACNLSADHLNAYTIGFVIGPCLNAGGRLESAKVALRLLLTDDEDEAVSLARHLTGLNNERKDMTAKGCEEAYKLVDDMYSDDDVLVVYLKECHESIAGIIAGRVKERYNKPSIVLTQTEGDMAKGSGRSIEAYHMFDKLCEVSDLLIKFGGHPMAAGMSLKESDIDEFRKRLNENSGLTKDDFVDEIWIDVAMPLSYISEKLIGELDILEPYGHGNDKPAFAQKDVKIANVRIMGRENNVVKLSLVSPEGTRMDGLVFIDGSKWMEQMGESKIIDIIYYPQINEYMGRKNLQVVIRGWKFK